jgi:hypothetical protein
MVRVDTLWILAIAHNHRKPEYCGLQERTKSANKPISADLLRQRLNCNVMHLKQKE